MRFVSLLRACLVTTALLSIGLLAAPSAPACGGHVSRADRTLLQRALSGGEGGMDRAVDRYRGLGPDGLTAVLAARTSLEHALGTAESWNRLVDRVAGQRDASRSLLFWHTDLDRAVVRARESDRPILSLRMLGDLREQYSCANSRFFRTALYTDPGVSDLLRDRFVLHWSSEREVPRVTIDFGDGRVVHRTLTGNSAHYVLDSDGRPIDVLPGLYHPGLFTERLEALVDVHDALAELEGEARETALAGWHREQIDRAVAEVVRAYGAEQNGSTLRFDGYVLDRSALRTWMTSPMTGAEQVAPPAIVPMRIAMSKAAIERPMLDGTAMGFASAEGKPMIRTQRAAVGPTTRDWETVAVRAVGSAELSEASVELMRSEHGPVMELSDVDFADMLERFNKDLAVDSLNNEYRLHPVIHSWFAAGKVNGGFVELNERVYDEIFLTPSDDPWLGLVDPTVYTGLEGGGVMLEEPGATWPEMQLSASGE